MSIAFFNVNESVFPISEADQKYLPSEMHFPPSSQQIAWNKNKYARSHQVNSQNILWLLATSSEVYADSQMKYIRAVL